MRRILFILVLYCFGSESSHANSQKIFSIQSNCTNDLMQIHIDVDSPFKGMLFAKGFSEECRSNAGSSSLTLPLKIPNCGVRSKVISPSSTEYSVQLIAQMDSKLQLKTDMEVTANCVMPSEMIDINLSEKNSKQQPRNGRMRFQKMPTKIRSWMELFSKSSQDYAIVGENSTLSIHALIARNVGMRVVDCVAFDGVGENSQRLFDENGCAIDTQIMPDFIENVINIEDGWSKIQDDDIVQKTFTSKFQAFKFPDRDIIHVNCGVQLCSGKCVQHSCEKDSIDPLPRPMARLEVFNSIKVIAPQIEIDKMERNHSSNVNPSAQSAYFGPDVLCVSSSKLALAFCTLGIIFLVAVVVAVCCSLRYLSHKKSYMRSPPSDHSGRRSIFSITSGTNPSQSSLEFDSKLFAYGRVY